MRQVFFSYDDLMMSIQNGAITMFCWLFTVKERGIEEKKNMDVRYIVVGLINLKHLLPASQLFTMFLTLRDLKI